ncbi:MAG: hypothetical protein ABL971_15915 [Vicinamibacterales bacterium]
MNYSRIAVAGFVAWVVSLPIGFLVNEVLLSGLYAANAAAFRPDAEMMANLPYGFGMTLVGMQVFAYMFARGYEGGSGISEGVRFGACAGLLIVLLGTGWNWVTTPISASLGLAMAIDLLVEAVLYGAIVGAVYRPLAGTKAA